MTKHFSKDHQRAVAKILREAMDKAEIDGLQRQDMILAMSEKIAEHNGTRCAGDFDRAFGVTHATARIPATHEARA